MTTDRVRKPRMCLIDGCPRESRIRGCCGQHDYRILHFGDPFLTRSNQPRQQRTGTAVRAPMLCIEPGCGKAPFAHRRCQPHYVTAYLDAIPAGCYA